MTEADILNMRIGLTGLVISVVSVSFGMCSAYIVGMWLFLKQAPLMLRTLAFCLLSLGLLFMGVVTWGVHELLQGSNNAWSKLPRTSMDALNFGYIRPEILMGLSIYEAGALLGLIAFVAIYAALGYLTFFYKWNDAEVTG